MQEDSQAAPVFVFSPSKYADICYGCFTRVVRRRCSCRKKNQSHAEKQWVVMELWSPRLVTYNTVIDCVKDLDYKRYYY